MHKFKKWQNRQQLAGWSSLAFIFNTEKMPVNSLQPRLANSASFDIYKAGPVPQHYQITKFSYWTNFLF